MPNVGVARRSSSLRRTRVRLVPYSLRALTLAIFQRRPTQAFDDFLIAYSNHQLQVSFKLSDSLPDICISVA